MSHKENALLKELTPIERATMLQQIKKNTSANIVETKRHRLDAVAKIRLVWFRDHSSSIEATVTFSACKFPRLVKVSAKNNQEGPQMRTNYLNEPKLTDLVAAISSYEKTYILPHIRGV